MSIFSGTQLGHKTKSTWMYVIPRFRNTLLAVNELLMWHGTGFITEQKSLSFTRKCDNSVISEYCGFCWGIYPWYKTLYVWYLLFGNSTFRIACKGCEKECWYFQQDGATTHTASNSVATIHNSFRDWIITHLLWLAHLRNLMPWHFTSRGSLKDSVYENTPQADHVLKEIIRCAISAVFEHKLQRVFNNLLTRCHTYWELKVTSNICHNTEEVLW